LDYGNTSAQGAAYITGRLAVDPDIDTFVHCPLVPTPEDVGWIKAGTLDV
jgi:hypothetical protein